MRTMSSSKPTPSLDEHRVEADPVRQFERWYLEVQATSNPDPSAMTLATATPQGAPSARIVLLKSFGEQGFVFFTNYHSRKGHELMHNPRAALLFHWPELARQVRLEGIAHRIPAEESDAYFQTRPRGSQIGALASEQSQPIDGRAVLEARVGELSQKLRGQDIPRPTHWGGYRLVPESVEFWQGRQDRLHDRIRYTHVSGAHWRIERLSP